MNQGSALVVLDSQAITAQKASVVSYTRKRALACRLGLTTGHANDAAYCGNYTVRDFNPLKLRKKGPKSSIPARLCFCCQYLGVFHPALPQSTHCTCGYSPSNFQMYHTHTHSFCTSLHAWIHFCTANISNANKRTD